MTRIIDHPGGHVTIQPSLSPTVCSGNPASVVNAMTTLFRTTVDLVAEISQRLFGYSTLSEADCTLKWVQSSSIGQWWRRRPVRLRSASIENRWGVQASKSAHLLRALKNPYAEVTISFTKWTDSFVCMYGTLNMRTANWRRGGFCLTHQIFLIM